MKKGIICFLCLFLLTSCSTRKYEMEPAEPKDAKEITNTDTTYKNEFVSFDYDTSLFSLEKTDEKIGLASADSSDAGSDVNSSTVYFTRYDWSNDIFYDKSDLISAANEYLFNACDELFDGYSDTRYNEDYSTTANGLVQYERAYSDHSIGYIKVLYVSGQYIVCGALRITNEDRTNETTLFKVYNSAKSAYKEETIPTPSAAPTVEPAKTAAPQVSQAPQTTPVASATPTPSVTSAPSSPASTAQASLNVTYQFGDISFNLPNGTTESSFGESCLYYITDTYYYLASKKEASTVPDLSDKSVQKSIVDNLTTSNGITVENTSIEYINGISILIIEGGGTYLDDRQYIDISVFYVNKCCYILAAYTYNKNDFSSFMDVISTINTIGASS